MSKMVSNCTFVFTNVFLTMLMYGLYLGRSSHFYSVSCCCAYGSTISFSLLPFFDITAYKRHRDNKGFSVFVFYSGHFVLHILPCILILFYPPLNIHILHGLLANIVQLSWALLYANTLYLDNVYSKLSKRNWNILWGIALLFHYFIPLTFKNS